MNEYQDIEASVLRWATDFAEQQTLIGQPMIGLNLDAYATPQSWPQEDFVAISEFMVDFPAGGLPLVRMAIVVSTISDENLHRMSRLVNSVINALIPPAKIPILNATTGVPRGDLHVIGNLKVDAVVETETQSARPILVTLRSDQQFGRSPP